MRDVEWHDALLAIEQDPLVVMLLVSDHGPSKVMRRRVGAYAPLYRSRGATVVCLRVTEDCAEHPELSAVYLPQVRIFENGELARKLVGVQDDSVFDILVS